MDVDRTVGTNGWDLAGAKAVIATMHGKERVIAPLLEHELGLVATPATGLDTDRFGTFTLEIPRAGSQIEAARAKALAALELHPEARVAVASEGAFAPHLMAPHVSVDREIVLLADRVCRLEIIGTFLTTETMHRREVVTTPQAALAFASRVGFPSQGIVLRQPGPQVVGMEAVIARGVQDSRQLESLIASSLRSIGSVIVETDLRAHMNPLRMAAIGRAAADMVERAKSACPACSRPGFGITERVPGLPCSWCGAPTRLVRINRFRCTGCGTTLDRPTEPTAADPGQCEYCNP